LLSHRGRNGCGLRQGRRGRGYPAVGRAGRSEQHL